MKIGQIGQTRQFWRGLWLVALLAAIPVGFASLAAHASDPPVLVAQSVQELQERKEAIDEKRQQLQQQRDRLEDQTETAEDQLENLENTITATASQIADAEYRLKQAEQRLQDLQKDLEQAEASYYTMQQATVARLQFLQRQRGSEGWAILLQSTNFNQFLERRYQLRRVYEADRAVLVDLKAQADEIKRQRAVVEEQKNSVALIRQELLAKKQQYEAEAEQQSQLIGRLQQDRAALEAAEAQLARDSEEIAALIRERLAASSGAVLGTGRFIYPVSARISSGFGNRIHPILGYSRFHAGVDFGASHGSTIRAADAGRVIFAGWYGGYGRAVIVDHGNGITTLYAHTSGLYVSQGQVVSQGQAIAAVGSTGLSTGPHLHFEVRQNGNPVNPMGYL